MQDSIGTIYFDTRKIPAIKQCFSWYVCGKLDQMQTANINKNVLIFSEQSIAEYHCFERFDKVVG